MPSCDAECAAGACCLHPKIPSSVLAHAQGLQHETQQKLSGRKTCFTRASKGLSKASSNTRSQAHIRMHSAGGDGNKGRSMLVCCTLYAYHIASTWTVLYLGASGLAMLLVQERGSAWRCRLHNTSASEEELAEFGLTSCIPPETNASPQAASR